MNLVLEAMEIIYFIFDNEAMKDYCLVLQLSFLKLHMIHKITTPMRDQRCFHISIPLFTKMLDSSSTRIYYMYSHDYFLRAKLSNHMHFYVSLGELIVFSMSVAIFVMSIKHLLQ